MAAGDGTYATKAEYDAYTDAPLPADPDLERLLSRAERDVDSLFLSVAKEANGLRFGLPKTTNEKNLTVLQVADLSDLTCAQAEYRYTMGEEFFVKAQYSFVSGPDISTRGVLPRIGPKVWDELARSDLLDFASKTGSVATGYHERDYLDVLGN